MEVEVPVVEALVAEAPAKAPPQPVGSIPGPRTRRAGDTKKGTTPGRLMAGSGLTENGTISMRSRTEPEGR